MNTKRIEVGDSASIEDRLEFFIVTGSMEPPIVCLADNNGYPFVRDLYARQFTHQGKNGVHVSVRFESKAQGKTLAINLFQPNMAGDYTIIPLV